MIYEVKGTEQIQKLFDGWQETMIWSCLQGVMGRLYCDSPDCPESAMAIIGDFCFFAGKPNSELAAYKPDWCNKNFIIMTARDPEWFSVIETVYGTFARKVIRYSIKKEFDVFDTDKLTALKKATGGKVELHMIDMDIFEFCRKHNWSRDFVSNYADYEEYKTKGIGVVALKNGEPVSGASSYSRYKEGIEIQITTKEEYRRQGFAASCGAMLILECLKRGLYPSWDAQNLQSVALAEKLGYHFDREYTAYEIRNY